jgi:hypothetical protein
VVLTAEFVVAFCVGFKSCKSSKIADLYGFFCRSEPRLLYLPG